ncbi:MAG: LytTR family transcriptional regulator DNA-binding domain-containing protein [Bradyrhizobiaceae bacterium]|nr:LytTR family transcriptional regulator DNA-binding domain-containing protein [Bradyrhizobiaceae bacterium]
MPVTYEPWLVALSIIIAIQGAYVGLTLTAQIGDALGVRRRLLLAGAAFSLAIAIWAMHFVGMLAVRLPFPVNYLVFPTLLSFLVCVIVVGGAVFATSCGPLTELRLTLSSCLMGGGIFTMHYIGMSALEDSAFMIHGRVFVVASMAIAIGASGLALWLATYRGGRPPLIISATVFGIAISGLHYTAMAGVTLYPIDSKLPAGLALSTDLLAIIVAFVAFCVSGGFLLTLVPDHRKAVGQTDVATAALVGISDPVSAPVQAASPQVAVAVPDTGFEPNSATPPPTPIARRLPIERDGATHFIAVNDIVAVHANAHYSYIFDGSTKLFCPLAIGDVEARLDKSRFIRVHRSHIVNIDRVMGYRRSGDNEFVELNAADSYGVPVSRSRIRMLKSLLESRVN